MDPSAFGRGDASDSSMFPFGTAPASAGPRSIMAPFQPIPQVAPQHRPNMMPPHQAQKGPHASMPLPPIDPSVVTGSKGLQSKQSIKHAHAIPVTKDTANFREILPELEVEEEIPVANNEKIIAESSFVCEIGGSGVKNLREKACALCLEYRTSRSSNSIKKKIKFKVYAGSTIRRGKRALRRDFFAFMFDPQVRAVIFCRTPLSGRGSLKWTQEKKEKFIAFEDGMLYSLQVISTDPGAECSISALYPPGLLVADTPLQRAQDYHGLKSSKRGRDGEGWPESKKPRINGSIVDRSLVLVPDLDANANKVSVGFRVASYSFKCQMLTGPKNLRQRANTFDVMIENNGDSNVPKSEELRHLKFKIYADSTIRRGKKLLRRNDFVFRIGEDRVVNVFCKTPLPSRGSLKWTMEKQEAFLAFECGLEYVIQVYSKHRTDDARIFLVTHNEGQDSIVDWRDEIHPERSTEAIMKPAAKPEVGAWRMEPSIWNMSLNKAPTYLVLISAPPGKLPASPLVVFHAKDKKIEVRPYQYDMRNKSSMLISVPRLFSEEKAEQATMQGVQFSRQIAAHIINERGQTVWSTNFTYEVGVTGDNSGTASSTAAGASGAGATKSPSDGAGSGTAPTSGSSPPNNQKQRTVPNTRSMRS